MLCLLVWVLESFYCWLLKEGAQRSWYSMKSSFLYISYPLLYLMLGAKVLFETLQMGYLELQDYLAIGAIFSATDSVCTLQVLNQDEMPLLYSLVFGEGVVNDATSVVLFNAIQKFDLSKINSRIALKFIGNFSFLFITSTLLGVLIGLLSAYIIKKLYFGRHAFATLSFIAETCIFLYVGMDALDIEKWQFVSNSPGKSIGASSLLLGLVLVGRASFIFPLSFLSNFARKSKSDKLNLNQQVTIWWAGLMRGAVSMALAYNQFAKSGHTKQPGNAIMITCTITVVLFSTVVFGLLTKHLLRLLLPPQDHHMLSSEPCSSDSTKLPLLSNREESEDYETSTRNISRISSLSMLLSTPYNSVHHYWRKFDDAYMRPVFGGRGFAVHLPGSPEEGRGDHPLI